MKKVIAIMLTVCMILMCFTACKDEDTIVGTWSSSGDEPSGYPRIMTLHEDGTGTADGINLNWYTNGDKLILSIALIGEKTYTYEVAGGFLRLNDYVYTRG